MRHWCERHLRDNSKCRRRSQCIRKSRKMWNFANIWQLSIKRTPLQVKKTKLCSAFVKRTKILFSLKLTKEIIHSPVCSFVLSFVSPYSHTYCRAKISIKLMSHERCLNVASTLFACRHYKQMATLFVLYLCNMLTLMSVSLLNLRRASVLQKIGKSALFLLNEFCKLSALAKFFVWPLLYILKILLFYLAQYQTVPALTRYILFVPRWRQIFDRKTSISDFNSQHVVIFLGRHRTGCSLAVLEFSGTFGHYVHTLHVNVIVCRDDCYRIKVLTVSFKFGCSQ